MAYSNQYDRQYGPSCGGKSRQNGKGRDQRGYGSRGRNSGGKGGYRQMKGGKDSRDGKGGYDDGPGAMVPRDANDKAKWRPCKYFAMGHCRNGARCKFSHNGAPPGDGYVQSYHHEASSYAEFPSEPQGPMRPPQGGSRYRDPPQWQSYEQREDHFDSREFELSAILGQAVSMARNQRGSRVLQEALEEQVS